MAAEDSEIESADIGAQVRTISLVEPEGARTSAIGWSRRAKIATADLMALCERFVAHGWDIEDIERIYDDSLRILVQTLLAEGRITDEELRTQSLGKLLLMLRQTGRVTNDEMVARCSEVQLMYLHPQFQQRATRAQNPTSKPKKTPNVITIGRTTKGRRTS